MDSDRSAEHVAESFFQGLARENGVCLPTEAICRCDDTEIVELSCENLTRHNLKRCSKKNAGWFSSRTTPWLVLVTCFRLRKIFVLELLLRKLILLFVPTVEIHGRSISRPAELKYTTQFAWAVLTLPNYCVPIE